MPTYRNMHGTPLQRFWRKVQITDSCWLWTGYTAPDGYGRWKPNTDAKSQLVHRWAFEQFVGPIREETLDHLCRVRNCVRPDHLDPVDRAENMKRSRKTHCVNGHPYDYVYINSQGRSANRCKVCTAAAQRTYQAKKRGQVD